LQEVIINPSFSLANKVAIMTGASRWTTGKVIALELAKVGPTLWLPLERLRGSRRQSRKSVVWVDGLLPCKLMCESLSRWTTW
jgi:hypothetical protein